MDVRTFEAHTMKEALKAVKKTFGTDAVILRTENVADPNGQTSRLIKITATKASEEKQIGAQALDVNSKADFSPQSMELLLDLSERLQRLEEKSLTRDYLESMECSIDELKLILNHDMKSSGLEIGKDSQPVVRDILRQLRLMSVEESYLVELAGYLNDLPGPGLAEEEKQKVEDEKEYYQNAAIKWTLKRIKIAPPWDVSSGSVSIHAILGATGVGKTSMIARLASHYKNTGKNKVLIVSFDNLKVAASEQLRILAKAMNIDFVSIDSVNELESVIERFEEPELVLIDTAGRSTKSKRHLDELQLMQELPLPIQKHLVLSMSEKQLQMDRSVRYFSELGLNSLMFSKLDQTWTYGEMFNVMSKWSLPTSFFGTGQQVPGGFERASRERVVERIFGL